MGATVINLGGTNTGFDAAMKGIVMGIQDVAKQLGDGPERRQALESGASILRDAMKGRVKWAKKDVKRYKDGRLIATYKPGNLWRSIKILDHMKDKKSVYVGVEIAPKGRKNGVFSGSTVDGWYAHFVEYGSRKRPFLRPALMSSGASVISVLNKYVQKTLEKAK